MPNEVFGRYYISPIIIHGAAYYSKQSFGLEEAIRLGKILDSVENCNFHISEKISDHRYEYVNLSDLGERIKDD